MKITINNKNLIEKTANLYRDIFNNTTYFSSIGIEDEWEEMIKSTGVLFIAEEEFQNNTKVLGFGICDKFDDTFVILYSGVELEYRNRGIWKVIFENIKNYATKNNFKYIGIENSEELFPLMTKFVKNNGFEELDRIKIQNNNESVRYVLKI